MDCTGMNDTKWGEIERLLKVGWTYSKIEEFTRTRYEYIKKIDDYIKENTNEKLS